MNSTLLNPMMYRELVSALNFAVRMGKRAGINDVQSAIADAYQWAGNVQDAVNMLVPQFGWPALQEIESGKIMRRAPEPKLAWTEDEVTQVMDANVYPFYNAAYYFAKSMQSLEKTPFSQLIPSYDHVFAICNAWLDAELADDGGYNGTNVRKNSDWYEKNLDRQEFLQEVLPLLETRNPNQLTAIHAQIMESHKELVEQQAAETEAKLGKIKVGLFGKDFAFQDIPAVSSKMPAFNPAPIQ